MSAHTHFETILQVSQPRRHVFSFASPPSAPVTATAADPEKMFTTTALPRVCDNRPNSSIQGVWSEEEHDRFLEAMRLFPKGLWKDIAAHVGTRSVRQVQTHAQKYYEKVERRTRGLRKERKRMLRTEHRLDQDSVGCFGGNCNQSGSSSNAAVSPSRVIGTEEGLCKFEHSFGSIIKSEAEWVYPKALFVANAKPHARSPWLHSRFRLVDTTRSVKQQSSSSAMSAAGSAHTSSPRSSTASGSSSGNGGGAMAVPSLPPPTVTDAQDWCSVVLDYSLRFEHIALNITSHRILYHLKLELEQPIPSAYLEFSNYLCLGWPLGGIWKITKRDGENRFLTCVAWKQTELSTEEIAELAKQFAPAPVETQVATTASPSFAASIVAPIAVLTRTAALDEPAHAIHSSPQTLFDWKMQLGTWKHSNHWFVREVGLPPAYAAKCEIPSETLLSAKLFAGLTPVEVSMVVNSIQSVDTVAQRFTADVTWELTLRGITTMREDSVLRELLDMLEFNEDELEFSNLTDMHSEKPVVTVLSQEGERIQYLDPFVPKEEVKQRLHDLKYSRRLMAEFSEEMSLYSFPLDQQKLTFSFNMSKSIASFIPIAPPTGTPGRFALENFKLGNVWNVVCGDKLFVGDVVDSGSNKMIRFETMLERRCAYYLTNVAIPAAIITYLCFISYAPVLTLDDTSNMTVLTMMDTGARLQIVLTLLLTAVTFKSQVASLIPQVSYFTTLDKYVFVCFIITCAVAIENALYSMFVKVVGADRSDGWREYKLFWISVWAFTFLNVAWGLYLWQWTRGRNFRTKVLMAVTEYVRVIATAIPNKHKEQVLRGFLEDHKYDPKFLPQFFTTKRGDLFVKLPSDSPTEETDKSKRQSGIFRKQALRDLPAIQKYFRELDPDCMSPVPSPVSSPAASPVSTAAAVSGVAAVVAKQYGDASVVINIQEVKAAAGNAGSTHYFAHGG